MSKSEQKEPKDEISPAIYLPRGSRKEQEYLGRHGIELIRLGDGITIVAVPYEVSDLAEASIRWIFPAGSFFDPPGKEGLHHFLEHFFNQALWEQAKKHDVFLQASTSQLMMSEYAEGTANPSVVDYGIWPMLPEIRRALAAPLKTMKNTQRSFENEKNVILAEIQEEHASHDRQVSRFFRETIWSPSNPESSNILGTSESLARITVPDFLSLIETSLIPQDLIISILTKGKVQTNHVLAESIIRLFEEFPRGTQKRPVFDWFSLETLNPNLEAGKFYEKDTGLKNGLVTFTFAWPLETEPYTTSYFALDRLSNELGARLFMTSRAKGWSYSVRSGLDTPGESTSVFTLEIDSPKPKDIRNFAKKLLSEIRQDVLGSVDSREIERISHIESKRQKAIPIPVATYQEWILRGLRRYGKIIDADKIKEIYSQITPEHLSTWLEKILSQEPVFLIVGELGR